MDNEVEKVAVSRFIEATRSTIEDVVAREVPFTIILNNQELVTLLCSPKDLNFLAAGFLFSEGLLENKDEIKRIAVDTQRGIARVETTEDRALTDSFKRFITSGCGRGAIFYSAADAQGQAKVESQTKVPADAILALVSEFQHHSEVYRATGGVHSAALCDDRNILIFKEDIGRHNAIDKIFGECLLKDVPTEGRIVVTSGRISSEILLKVAKREIPILISKSAPTDLGVKLAENLGVTLIGFVRGKRMNVYTNDWRVIGHGE
ncbi:MAG: formate dehydrogenase accessory sulfurtransferase FdhD [Chloroflexota bacterium]